MAKLATAAQQVRLVMQELIRGSTIRSITNWRVNTAHSRALRVKAEKEAQEKALEEERKRAVEAEKMDRLRERQVAQAIVERAQDEMEHAKARAQEMEKRGKMGADTSEQRVLREQLRAEKEKSERLERRLKALEGRSNSPTKDRDKREMEELRMKLEKKEQERQRLEERVQELLGRTTGNQQPSKPSTPAREPKMEKPDTELTREEKMMRAAERRANNNWPGFKHKGRQ